jgi:hypothetical protein
MTFKTIIEVIPNSKTIDNTSPVNHSSFLFVTLAALATHRFSKKQFRKLRRRMLWQTLKMSAKNFFKKPFSRWSSFMQILVVTIIVVGAIVAAVAFGWVGLGILFLLAMILFFAAARA